MQLAAYYYPATKARPGALEIHRLAAGARPVVVSTRPCDGKRTARAMAQAVAATPWNF